MSTYKIIQGDCLEVMKSMPDKSIDLVLTDPPYGHNNNNGDLNDYIRRDNPWNDRNSERAGTMSIANDGHEANEIFEKFIEEANRLLRSGCCCCCCCCGGGPDPMFARWSLAMDKVFNFCQMVVWDKGPMGMGWRYRRSYETVLVASKKGDSMKWYDTSKKIENIIRPIGKIIPQADDHPTVKPVSLMEHFIRLHTQEGDMVLDPFCGSGTTGVAALSMGRNFIGIEIDPKYCELAEKRIKNECGLLIGAKHD